MKQLIKRYKQDKELNHFCRVGGSLAYRKSRPSILDKLGAIISAIVYKERGLR